jgi:hypothetical protein
MKTTLLGLFTAAAYAIQNSVQAGNSLLDWKSWIVPVGLSLLGYHARDVKK